MIEYTVNVYPEGDNYWYLNGICHREDGPAVQWSNGEKHWYLNGKKFTEQEFLKRTQKVQELTIAEISKRLGYEIKIVKEN